MDWIHCNLCYSQPSKENAFSLTSCGHMYCNLCLETSQEGSKDKCCKICNSKCICIKLVQDMNPEVRDYFMEPEDIVKKLLQVLDFQKKHRLKLTAHWISLKQKYSNSKKEIIRLQKVTDNMYRHMKELQEQNKKLISLHRDTQRVPQVQMTSYKSPPLQLPLYCSAKRAGHQPTIVSPPSQSYSSKFVTPLRVNKQLMSNGHPSSLRNKVGMVRCSNATNYAFNNSHAFLTPPSDSPSSVHQKHNIMRS